jgi:homopolymeric O-antigen transport system permease protein
VIFDRPPSGGIPYPVFLLTGLTLWVYISAALSRGAISTVGASALIEKVYFPRILIPLASIIPPLVDFVLAFGVLIVMMLLYGVSPSWHIVFAPAVLMVAIVVVLGLSFLLSGLVVRYRDVQFAIPFAVQLLLFMSAVIYPLSRIPDNAEAYFAINPFVGLMQTFRWTMLSTAESPGLLLLVPAAAGVLLVLAGLLYFQRAERTFADVI